jgi:transcriptional regulator with XRE-family HTH domain
MLAMDSFDFDQPTPPEIAQGIAARARARRKEHGFTQAELSRRAGVSLGSLRRFESSYEISLKSLIKIGIALECSEDFATLFARRHYRSIQEIIDEHEG